jgi:two-component system, OmpR family, response regulator CpxR
LQTFTELPQHACYIGAVSEGNPRILVIDDDAELASLLGEFLRREGFDVAFAHDGEKGLQAALASPPRDLIVLDVMLPGMDGFAVLRKLREKSRVPVLMLTARGEDVDRIIGLELGADDYLPKPFNPRELAARIRAILRRAESKASASPAPIAVNGVTLDPSTREVVCDGRSIEFTTIEFEILQALMRAAGRVLSRDDVMEQLYQRKSTPFDRAIDVHIAHVRKKLETDREIIKTVRGVGYQFLKGRSEESAT